MLFTFRSGSFGHFLPLVPLAYEARDAGHAVAFASGVDQSQRVADTGFPFFAAGLTYAESGRALRGRYPEWPWGNDFEHVYALVFAGVCGPAMANDLPAVFDSFRPDVVVAELAEFGGPVAAAAASIPWATVGWALPIPKAVAEAAGEAAGPMWVERGLDAPPCGGLYQHCYLDPCPPSLGPGDGPAMTRVQPLRPQQLSGLYSTSGSVPELAARPTVYVTLGTAGGFAGEGDRMMAAVAEGLGGENLNVVVTGTAADSSVAIPPNVHVRRFVPLADLLPRCHVVVSHAGAGTVLAALRMGLPQVMLPMGADQFRNATAVEQAGAGVQIAATELDASTLRTAVLALLDDTTAAVAATRIQNEIAEMPDARSAMSVLEHLRT